MSHQERLAAAVRLTQANRTAKTQAHIDINTLVQQCPAHQPRIFVVPVRYALSEEPAAHPACQPGAAPKSHPLAARPLRSGFVYVWHHQGPLKRYAVGLNALLKEQPLDAGHDRLMAGELSGLALDKHHEAWMLYSEIPLSPKHCEQLKERDARVKRMRHLDLLLVANTLQAPHCAPLTDAKSVMAELIPATYDLALAIDYQRNQTSLNNNANQLGAQALKHPTPININAYTDAMHWLRAREKIAAHYPPVPDNTPPPGEWSAEAWAPTRTQTLMDAAHTASRGLYTVLACLDDDLGVLRDINHEQELVETRHEQWQADNNLRLSIGGFVRSLITEDAGELIGTLRYRYRKHEIDLTPEQAQQILDASSRLEVLAKERHKIYMLRGGTYNEEHDIRLHEVHLREQATVVPIRRFFPLELQDDMLNVVRDYQATKANNRKNTNTSDKVEQYIDLPAMNQWLDETAPAHFAQVQQRHETLYADRGLYLPRHHSGTWFVDYTDPDYLEWLDQLAIACLSAQCLRKVGAEQYADYVRSADDGALRQLFSGWNPSLEGAVNISSRSTELLSALALENQANAEQAIAKVLSALGLPMVTALAQRANDPQGSWNTLVKRLGAALLLLKSEHGAAPSASWLSILVAARLGNGVGLRTINEGGQRVWQLFGKAAEDLTQWAKSTGKAIGLGHAANIVNSPAVNGGAGLVALVALLLNSWNASNYLAQAGVLEGSDDQRLYDTASATLYAGAALVAVIDNQLRKNAPDRVLGINFSNTRWAGAPVLTLFGGFIGALSFGAAISEFISLQQQLEDAHSTLDPWLNLRHLVVGGQIGAFGTQAFLGFRFTLKAIAGTMTTDAAIARYLLWMGPLNYLIAVLGVLYLIAWYLQQTPMQNFLNYCCWSKARARDLSSLSLDDQQKELSRLYGILFTPRVSFVSRDESTGTSSHMGLLFTSFIDSLTIDLPGAEPGSAYLEITMVGNPRDTLAMRARVKNGGGVYRAQEPMQDIADCWIDGSRCQWIPAKEGQGLRLTGPFKKEVPNLFASQPSKVSLRLRYRTPLTSLLGALGFIGGERGVAFTLSQASGVVALRNDPTPELDEAKRYVLDGRKSSTYLQPGSQQ